MANATSTQLQELYVAYFGRAADPTGLDYWTASGITTSAFAADMYAQAEFNDAYGSLSVEAQVNQIYKNLFDRTAEVAGLTYWTQEINLGNLQLAEIATHLIWAAQNNSGSSDDKTALTNRTDAAVAYTAKVKESTEAILAYSPTSTSPWSSGANIAEAKSYLSGIDKDTASTAAGIAASVATIKTNGVQTATTAGKTYTLTTAVDSITGTDGNDAITASDTTLTTGDTVDGGSGTDTLSLSVDMAADTSVAGFTTTNVENLNVAYTDGDTANAAETLTINALNTTASKLTVSGLGTTTVEDNIIFNNVASGTEIGMSNATDLNVTANFVTAATSGTADSVSVSLSGVGSTADDDTTLTIGTGFETINISSTGSASTLDGITSSAKTMKITGDANLTMRVAQVQDETLDVIDASAFTGSLTLATTDDTSGEDDLVSSVDVADITITGGSGNDSINVSGNATGNEVYVDGGAGNDTVTIDAVITNASSTTAGDIFKGGDGVDKIVGDVDLFDAAAGWTGGVVVTGISGFETLSVDGFANEANTLNPANISADITTIEFITATANASTTVNAEASFGVTLTGSAILAAGHTLTADSGSGTSDVFTLANGNLVTSTNQMASTTSNLTTTDFETVTIDTGSYTTALAQQVAAINIGTANALTLSGSNGLTTTSVTGIITAATIDASALTGAFTMGAAAASGVTSITGGSGSDTLVGDAASTISGGAGNDDITGGTGNDTLSGGAGNDTITIGTGTDVVTGGDGNDTITAAGNITSSDTFDGGAGTDTISVTNASLTALNALSISDANTFNTGFSNIEKLSITDALAQTTFDIGYLDSVNHVKVTTMSAAQTLSGFDSGDTLELGETTGYDLTITMNGSSASTTDVLNVNLVAAASDDYNSLTIANVETINIDSSETTANATVRAGTIGLSISQATGGAAQTVNFTGAESITVDTVIAADTIDASGQATSLATDAGLAMTSAHTAAQTITGSGKVDTIYGSTKADTIDAGAGNDNIIPSTGGGSIDGGSGTDTYTIASAQIGANPEGAGSGTSNGYAINMGTTDVTATTVFGTTGEYLSNGSTLAAGTGRYIFDNEGSTNSSASVTISNIETLSLTTAGVYYLVGNDSDNSIDFGLISNLTAADEIHGGAGNDTIVLAADANGNGSAAVLEDATGIETIDLNPGSTALWDTKLTVQFTSANTEAFTIDATGLTDTGAVATIVLSDAEADGYVTFLGGAGADIMTAGDGGAIMTGGVGADELTGHSGVDTFVIAATPTLNGSDVIAAFTTGSDKLNIDALGAATSATTVTGIITVAAGTVYYHSADLNDAVAKDAANATVISGAAVWGTQAVTSFIILADTGATDTVADAGLFSFVNVGTDEVVSSELTLMAHITGTLATTDLLFA